jgi:hypothetical protein
MNQNLATEVKFRSSIVLPGLSLFVLGFLPSSLPGFSRFQFEEQSKSIDAQHDLSPTSPLFDFSQMT